MKRRFVMIRLLFLPAVLISLIMLVGCSPANLEPEAGQPDLDPPVETVSPVTTPAETVEHVKLTPSIEAVPELDAIKPRDAELPSGEVPQELFNEVLADLLANTNANRTNVEVIKSEAVIWSDGSIGCPQPDVMYTQALVDGYQVILGLDGRTYDYHLSESGYFILCENSLPPRPGGESPTR